MNARRTFTSQFETGERPVTPISYALGLDPSDDLVHDCPEGIDRWTENIQWNVRDENGLGVIWHLGTMPEDPRLWHIVVSITLPTGGVLATKMVAPGNGDFGAVHANLRTVEPFERWRFSFLGGMVRVPASSRVTQLIGDEVNIPVEVDLDLRAAYPVWVPEGSEAHGDWGTFHHEQAVGVSGTVTVAGQRYVLDGIGHRDHSIGARDLSSLRRAFWGNGIFTSGWGFATMQGEYADGDFQRAAVFRAGETIPARMIYWTRLATASGDPEAVAVVLQLGESETVEITGTIRDGMNFTVANGAEFCMGTDLARPDRYLLTNLFVDWTCNEERGIGYLDRGASIGLLKESQA